MQQATIGVIVPLCSDYQPKTERTPKLDYDGTFGSKTHMDNNLNWRLNNAPHFDVMPKMPDSYETYLYTADGKIPDKICPETDCEEVIIPAEPDISFVEKHKRHNKSLGQTGSRLTASGVTRPSASLPGSGQQRQDQVVKAAVGTEAVRREEQAHRQAEATPKTPQKTEQVRQRRHDTVDTAQSRAAQQQ